MDIEDRIDAVVHSKVLRAAVTLIAAAMVVGSCMGVSEQDYRDQVEQERMNCRFVEMGHYPAEQFPYCPDYNSFEDPEIYPEEEIEN